MGATAPDWLSERGSGIQWLSLDGGHWRVREDQVSSLTPLIRCLDRGGFPSGARCVRQTPKRKVWYYEACGSEAAGFFVKEYRSRGMIQALRNLIGTEPAKREWTVARRLGERGVQTYEVVSLGQRGRLWETARSYLITREVSGGKTLMETLGDHPANGDGFRRLLLKEVASLAAFLHERGVEHLDLHGGNLLVHFEEGRPLLFLVDLQRVRIAPFLSAKRRIRDLARLLHSLHEFLDAAERETFMKAYGARSGFTPSPKALQSHIEALRRRRLRSRTKRCLQEGSSFGRLKTKSRDVHHSRVFPLELLEPLLEEARAMKGGGGPSVLKDSSETTITRHLAIVGGQTWKICVKRYHVRGWLDRFKYIWRRSRARRSWLAGWGLRVRGIPTPMPWALLEERPWGIPGEGVVVMEDLQGAQLLNRFVTRFFSPSSRGDATRHRKFTRSLAEFFGRLHTQEVFHRDLKATNLLVQEDGDGWRVSLVDLDHVRFDRPVSRRERTLNLAQLNASIPSCVSDTYRWRFLQTYLKGSSKQAIRAMAMDILGISQRR